MSLYTEGLENLNGTVIKWCSGGLPALVSSVLC